MTSIQASLGIGSGLDTQALVTQLTNASKAARERQLNAKSNANEVRISATSQIKADLDGLADALGTLPDAPTNADVLTAMKAYVAAFNTLRSDLNEATKPSQGGQSSGVLAGDDFARSVASATARLTSASLSSDAAMTLATLGVSTARTGTLALDEAKFRAATTADLTGVTAALTNTGPLATAIKGVRDTIESSSGPLARATSRYARITSTLERQRTQMNEQSSKLSDRLTKQFALMDAQVGRLKALQSYVEQQVAAWNAGK